MRTTQHCGTLDLFAPYNLAQAPLALRVENGRRTCGWDDEGMKNFGPFSGGLRGLERVCGGGMGESCGDNWR